MRMAGMTEMNITEDVPPPLEAAGVRDVSGVDTDVDNHSVPSLPDRLTELGEATVGNVRCENPFIVTENVNVYYGDNHAIRDVTLEIGKKEVIALIGPSGCGKSTYLRCLNRMNDTIDVARVTGKIELDGQDIYGKDLDPVALRARVGMVSMTTWLTVRVSTAWRRIGRSSTISFIRASSAQVCSRRSRTAWTSPAPDCQAVSSSACVLPGRSP
jgi:ABC-type multidrug transport system fused ATPase/permease subunit